MREFIIIGSGFSALCAYFFLKKHNPLIISPVSNYNFNNLKLIRRKNLEVNKLFSKKSQSYGNLNYEIDAKTILHDRLSLGGNSNIWGGFIDISTIPKNFINEFSDNKIELEKLDFLKNGYMSNVESIRQLRYNNEILDASCFFQNIENGFVNTISKKDNYLSITFLSFDSNKIITLKAKKILLAISFPQLIDLLIRSKIINENLSLNLKEFDHKFFKNFNSSLNKYSKTDSCVVKYDFNRSLKHFFGLKKNIDKLNFKIPFYVDQVFSNSKKNINLKLSINEKKITVRNNLFNFGDSLHYCDLNINNENINSFLDNISVNLIGVSVPFVNQKKPGPISNDIVNNLISKL